LRFINWILDMVAGPVDFGEFGVLMVDEDTGELRPMLGADILALENETDEAVAEWWFRKEAEAFAIHGEAIVRAQ
jgi:hypothetical protein